MVGMATAIVWEQSFRPSDWPAKPFLITWRSALTSKFTIIAYESITVPQLSRESAERDLDIKSKVIGNNFQGIDLDIEYEGH